MTEAQKEFCKNLVLSLPPMESRDLTALQEDLQRLPGFQESYMKDVAARACMDSGNSNHALVESLTKELTDAHELYRSKGVTARYSMNADETDSNILLIKTYAEQMDPHNWATGYWSTEWMLTPDNMLAGKSSVHVYNFEDGSNVQMRASREFPSESVAASSDDMAKAIVKRIIESDRTLLQDLSDEDAVMTSLKQVRRILPITKTRMKWDDSAQRQVRLLNARKTA